MCDKTYGRRDYLQRHLKSHNANFTANLSSAGGGNMSAGPIAKAIKMGSGGQNQQIQVVQVPQGTRLANDFSASKMSLQAVELGKSLLPTRCFSATHLNLSIFDRYRRWRSNPSAESPRSFGGDIDPLHFQPRELAGDNAPQALWLQDLSLGAK